MSGTTTEESFLDRYYKPLRRPPDERRVDLGQQTPDAIASLRDLSGQIIIEATQHRRFGDIMIGKLQRARSTRQAASSLGNDVGIARIGLGFTDVQICDARIASSGR